MVSVNELIDFGGWALAIGMFIFEIIKYNSGEKRADRKEIREEFKSRSNSKKEDDPLIIHIEYIKESVSNIESKVTEIEKEIKSNNYDLVAMKEQIKTLFNKLKVVEDKLEVVENGK